MYTNQNSQQHQTGPGLPPRPFPAPASLPPPEFSLQPSFHPRLSDVSTHFSLTPSPPGQPSVSPIPRACLASPSGIQPSSFSLQPSFRKTPVIPHIPPNSTS